MKKLCVQCGRGTERRVEVDVEGRASAKLLCSTVCVVLFEQQQVERMGNRL